MPELPEVETVRKGLEKTIINKIIVKTELNYEKLIDGDKDLFLKKIVGQRILNILRRGKFLIFILSDFALISHLRMEGKYQFNKNNTKKDKHTHLIYFFDDNSTLTYKDTRKFGRIKLANKYNFLDDKSLKNLGPEPTFQDFNLEMFYLNLQKSNKMIKPLLLEQKVVVGLGNIYVDEVLFKAKINPQSIAKSFSKEKVEKIHYFIIKVLEEATKLGGSTIHSYSALWGEAGKFQQQLKVYGKKGQKCVDCQNEITKIQLKGRGTHFCNICQPL